MRLTQRFKAAYRALTYAPYTNLSLGQLDQLMAFAAFGDDAEPAITSQTALNYETLHSIVKLISEDLAKLPLNLFEQITEDERRVAVGHPVYALLKISPNPLMTAYTWRQVVMSHVLLWGNHYSQIVRDTNGQVRGLWPLDPSRMTAGMNGAERIYLYEQKNGETIALTQSEVFHVYGLGFDGIVGYNPITLALRQALTLAHRADAYGQDTLSSPIPLLVLKLSGRLEGGEQGKQDLVNRWVKALKERKRVAVLEPGMEVDTPVSKVPNDAAQLLSTRRFQKEQMAMYYRVPKHKLQDTERATFSNIEHQALEYVNDCLLPWAVNFEQAIPMQLLGARNHGRYFVKHNFYSLLRGDSKAQAEFFRTMFNIGVYSPNRILGLLDENGIGPDGDRRFVPMNMVPLDSVDEFLTSKAAPVARLLEGVHEATS